MSNKSVLITVVLACVLSVVVVGAVEGAVIIVKADGSGDYPTIQAAIDDVNDGDEVVCEDGTYTGDGNRDINFRGKAVTVRSENGPENCIIDCNGSKSEPHRGFYFYNQEDPNSIIDGITIANGFGPYKKIYGSTYSRGGAIHCYNNASPTIKNCIIKDNQARNGGAIECYAYCSPVIKNCIFMDNVAKDGIPSYGGAIYCQLGSRPKILNCLFLRNRVGAEHGAGGAIWSQNGGPVAINCNFLSNNAEWGGAIASIGGSSKYTNCIFWDNYCPSSGDDIANGSAGTITVTHCHLKSGLSWPSVYNGGDLIDGGGNTSGEPGFTDFENGDYGLFYTSLCVDAGINETTIELPDTDLAGNPRFVEGDGDGIVVVDIGAYEFQEPNMPFMLLTPTEFEFFCLKEGQNPEAQVLTIRKVGVGNLNWQITEDCSWLDVTPTQGSISSGEVCYVTLTVDVMALPNGNYSYELVITDPDAGNSPQILHINLYVCPIQLAIDAAEDGDTVVITPGIYTGKYNRDIDFGGKAITVRSIDPNDPVIVAATVIDCNGNEEEPHRGFYFHSDEDGNSVLSGFTIINGYAHNGAGVYCSHSSPVISNCNFMENTAENWGGGACCYASSAVISNCTFVGNSASHGGAITTNSHWNHPYMPVVDKCKIVGNTASGSGGGINIAEMSSLTISNCTITSNSAGEYGGGGVSISQSNPTITNCLITGNSSYSSGGGILQRYYFEDGSRIIKCTIAGNSAYEASGIYCGSEMAVVNSIVWGNAGDFLPEVLGGGDLTFSYCDVKGSGGSGTSWNGDFGADGGGNIDDDPCFALITDYHLMAGSHCIDSGDPNYAAEPNDMDLDGNERVLDGDGDGNSIVDMGAYEYNPSSPSRIAVSPSRFNFWYAQGWIKPTGILQIRNCGSGVLNWEIVEDCNWLEVSSANGVSEGEIDEVEIIVEPNLLGVGVYQCRIEVHDANAVNSPVEVDVSLRVGAVLRVPSQYPTIQSAIDAAVDYDMVFVGDGVYTGYGNWDLDYKGKAITVCSENGAENCIVDCNGTGMEPHRGFYFNKGENEGSVLDGFTITNGWAEVGSGILCYNSNPRITNCRIIGNSSHDKGGGIACNASNPKISNCTINKNSTGREGGGISCDGSSPVISNCTINDNTANEGGGISCMDYSNPSINHCTILGNSAQRDGGGIFCREESNPRINNCSIIKNTADEGGGLYIETGNNAPTITNCRISGNVASGRSGRGGAIYCRDCEPTVTNSIITGNTAKIGGGVIGCEGDITSCTIIGNLAWDRGGGVAYCMCQITNCIIRDNFAPEDPQLPTSANLTFSCAQDWTGSGEGNIDMEPGFVAPGYWVDVNDVNVVVEPNDANAVWVEGDYHLLEGSPCINAGDPNYVAGPGETDLDGNERVVDGRIDMGAYEYVPPVEVEVKLTPHMLNCQSSGKWVKAHVILPEGYWPEDVDVNTPAVAEPMGAESEYIKVFDNGKGKFGIEIGFDREAFCAAGVESEDGYLEVKVRGWLLTGERFEGTDTIKVISRRWRHRERITTIRRGTREIRLK